jgi:lysophospholipase L1-like esterase
MRVPWRTGNIARIKFLAVLIAVLVVAAALIAVFSGAFRGKMMRVACIGDSITELSTYPTDLEELLGCNYYVREFGVTGSTVVVDSYTPYLYEPRFSAAKLFLPDIVVILLGTNDARTDTYQSIGEFVADYKQLIGEVQALENKQIIYLVKPPPIFENELSLSNDNLVGGVIPRIEQVANDLGLPLIDAYTPLVGHPEYFVDGVHPNYDGASIIANQVYQALTK